MPPGLRWILTINFAVFFVMLLTPSGVTDFLFNTFGFYSAPGRAFSEPWRFVTYMFLHAGLFHIFFNMLWVWFLGRMVEEQLGTKNFLVIYFGAGIGGALIDVLITSITGGGEIPTVGASGAVFGVMVVFAMLFPTFQLMLLLLPPIQARYLVAGLIIIDFLLIGSGGNINRIVHLGGALWGYLLLKMYYRGYNYDAWISSITDRFKRRPHPGKTSPKTNPKMSSISDAEILDEEDQNELDRILEKISKSGYEGLSAEEKRRLFEISKRDK